MSDDLSPQLGGQPEDNSPGLPPNNDFQEAITHLKAAMNLIHHMYHEVSELHAGRVYYNLHGTDQVFDAEPIHRFLKRHEDER